jgi:hypothetical protein
MAIRKEIVPTLEKIIKKYSTTLHPDLIEVALTREVHLQCAIFSLRMNPLITK